MTYIILINEKLHHSVLDVKNQVVLTGSMEVSDFPEKPKLNVHQLHRGFAYFASEDLREVYKFAKRFSLPKLERAKARYEAMVERGKKIELNARMKS